MVIQSSDKTAALQDMHSRVQKCATNLTADKIHIIVSHEVQNYGNLLLWNSDTTFFLWFVLSICHLILKTCLLYEVLKDLHLH